MSSSSKNQPSPSTPMVASTTTTNNDVTQTQSEPDTSLTGISHSGQNLDHELLSTTTATIIGSGGGPPIWPPRTTTSYRGNTEWYNMCTEGLGFESMEHKDDVGELKDLLSRTTSSSRNKKKNQETKKMEDFPPYMPTLDLNGRPRFNFERVTTEDGGRLTMVMREKDQSVPEIVRTTGEDGNLVLLSIAAAAQMNTTTDDQEDEEDNDIDDDHEQNENQNKKKKKNKKKKNKNKNKRKH